jgi:hypothetical protein
MIKEEKYSGQTWAKKLNITVIEPKGWFSVDEFNHIRITKEEFMNRASNSTLKTVLNVTRRNAKKLLNKI